MPPESAEKLLPVFFPAVGVWSVSSTVTFRVNYSAEPQRLPLCWLQLQAVCFQRRDGSIAEIKVTFWGRVFGTEGGRQTSSIDLPPMCFFVLQSLPVSSCCSGSCFVFGLFSVLVDHSCSVASLLACLLFRLIGFFYFGPGHQLLLKRNFRFVSCQTWQILSKNGGPFVFCLCSFWVSPNSKQVKKEALPVDRKAPSVKSVIPAWEK